MMWNKRYMVWTLGAVFCAAVVYFAPAPDAAVVQPGPKTENRAGPGAMAVPQSPSPSQISSSSQSTPQWHLLQLKSRQVADDLTVLFSDGLGRMQAAANAKPPPPVVQQVAIATQQIDMSPPAPPLPFKYVGRYVDDGQTKFFLQNQGQDIVVKVGDTIGQTYKLEAMSASTLTFVFIPANEKQILGIGDAP